MGCGVAYMKRICDLSPFCERIKESIANRFFCREEVHPCHNSYWCYEKCVITLRMFRCHWVWKACGKQTFRSSSVCRIIIISWSV